MRNNDEPQTVFGKIKEEQKFPTPTTTEGYGGFVLCFSFALPTFVCRQDSFRCRAVIVLSERTYAGCSKKFNLTQIMADLARLP